VNNKIAFLIIIVIFLSLLMPIKLLDYRNKISTIYQETNLLEDYKTWKTGDLYTLHDPFYNEVIEFLQSNVSSNLLQTLENAKKIGIRSALVEIIMSEELYLKDIIGFDTMDKGLCFFEFQTGYQVYPQIGKKYNDCVEGNPYKITYFNDTIVDILTIW